MNKNKRVAIVMLLCFAVQLGVFPMAAQPQAAAYYYENFENYPQGQSFSGQNGWTVSYTDEKGETVPSTELLYAEPVGDRKVGGNQVGLFYDATTGGTNPGNCVAVTNFDRKTGAATDNIVTVQLRWQQKETSKNTRLTLMDGTNTLCSMFINPSSNCGMTYVAPSTTAGAGGAVTDTHLEWGVDHGNGQWWLSDNWRTVRFVINTSTQRIQVYWNGSLKVTSSFVSAQAGGIDGIRLATSNSSISDVCLDDICVIDGTDLSTVLPIPTATPAGTTGPTQTPNPTPTPAIPKGDVSSLYEWGNVAQGGGGFVLSVLFHPKEKDLIYIRTDIGGAYRWEGVEKRWVPLCDMFNTAQSGLFGIDGFALDPNNTETVYMAAGKYTYSTDGDVYKSTNRGTTWQRTGLTTAAKAKFSGAGFDGNGGSRGSGERVAVDPNNSSVIYASLLGGGLWRSKDGAATWEYVELPGFDPATEGTKANGYKQPRSIVFDATSASGGKSQTIYVGMMGRGLYKSTDGGETFVKETDVLIGDKSINRIEVAASGNAYFATSKGVIRYAGGVYTDISPAQMLSDSGGKTEFTGIAVDPTDENKIVAMFSCTNYMRMPAYRTTDGGLTWTDALAGAQYTRTNQWLETDNFSSNTHCIAMDPFDPKRVMFTDFFSVWETKNIWEQPTKWINPVWGIEEMVPFTAVSPPTGPYSLISAVADNFGMFHTDINKYPTGKISSRSGPLWLMSATGFDFCENKPNIMALVGVDHYGGGRGGYSMDGGKTWKNFGSLPKQGSYPAKYGKIAVSADVDPATGFPTLLVAPVWASPYYSKDMGKTWIKCPGPLDFETTGGNPLVHDYWNHNHPITADRVNKDKFYMWLNGSIYVTTDGCVTWTKTASIGGWDTKATYIKAAPGIEGEVWVSTNGGSFKRSSDSGATWSNVSFNTQYKNVIFGFGKEAPGSTLPTVYAHSTRNGFEGLFRSLDMGVTWEKLNSTANILGDVPATVDGDRQNFGAVYVGSDGRGFYYGRPKVNLVHYEADFANHTTGWALTNMTPQDGALVADGMATAVYQSNDFCRYFVYTATISQQGTPDGGYSSLLFNYLDADNHYFVKCGSNGVSQLVVRKDGVDKVLGTAAQTMDFTKDTTIEILRETGGYMTVLAQQGGTPVKLFDRVQDSTFQQGKIGVASNGGSAFAALSMDNTPIVNFGAQLTQGAATLTSLAQAAGSEATLKLSFRSNTAAVSCYLVVAIKDEKGVLQAVQSDTQILIDGTTSVSIPVNIPTGAGAGWTAECLYWNSYTGLRPLSQKIIF